MVEIFVLSNDPALAETLGSELPGFTLSHAPLKEAARAIEAAPSLLILDDPAQTLSDIALPIVKINRPVRLSDLLYTIHARLQSKTAFGPEYPLAGGYYLLREQRLLRAEGNADIALTEKETDLLLCLLEDPQANIPRDQLLKRVWGYSDDIATHTLETHIYRLRGKLRQADAALDIVFSEEGGYQINTQSHAG